MIVLETIAHRWTVLVFVAAMLWSAWPEGGAGRALFFLGLAFGLSFAAEFASTHLGLPYGRYDYVARGRELHLGNVPAFVPLGFAVVVWAGRSLAVRTRAVTHIVALVLWSAVFATLLDAVVDPMTLRGSSWYLGDLYRYRASGAWYGVPWSNFGGWLLVAGAIVAVDVLVLGRRRISVEAARRGRALAAGVCAHFIVLSLVTRHWGIAGGTAAVSAIVLRLSRPRLERSPAS